MNLPSRSIPKNEDFSSSSDDEISIDAFREACDEKFLPQSLFTMRDSSISETKMKVREEMKPSLRVTEHSDNFESFGVSPSFKDYVAKKLDALLDRSIIDEDGDNFEEDVPKKRKKKERKKERMKNEAGIKLLSSSDEIITKVEQESNDDEQRRIIKPWKFTRESESTNMTKCQEVAVDSNWILSKNETKAWSERSKGAVFKYKRGCNGALIEQQ